MKDQDFFTVEHVDYDVTVLKTVNICGTKVRVLEEDVDDLRSVFYKLLSSLVAAEDPDKV